MYPSTSTAQTLTAPTPAIVGRPVVGEILGVDISDWPPGTAFGFQWYADDVPINGANEPRLILTRALAYTSVSVAVYASVPRGCAIVTRSEPSRVVVHSA